MKILCKCGCGAEISPIDKKGRPVFWIKGHYQRRRKASETTRKRQSYKKIEWYKRNPNTIGFRKGNKLGEHPNAKVNRFKKGQKLSLETRQKIAKANTGENNYLWNGGKDLKARIRGCYKYRQWRSDIFTRDDFTCVWCGLRGVYLEADHHPKLFSEILKEYEIRDLNSALGCEEFWNINNGRTLCRKCHDKTKIWWKKRKI